MATEAAPRRRAGLPGGWPIYVVFGAFPVWWLLGMGAFIWPLITVILMIRLIWLRDRIRVPRGFGVYLLFLLWVLGSATQVRDTNDLMILAYRFSLYLSGGVLFITVYNEPSWRLTDGRVLGSMLVVWATVVLGGFLGMFFPDASITTPVEGILPGPLAANQWIQDLTHVRFAQVQDFLGYSIYRPSAPFTYTNEWGSALALLTPFVIAFLMSRQVPRWPRPWLFILLLASIVPAAVSVNRGLWLSLGIGVVYAMGRLAKRGKGAIVLVVLLALTGAVAIVWFTDLRALVIDRIETPHSNEGRLRLYQEAVDASTESPLLGFGVPQAAAETGPRVGTHGFVWLLLVSHGIPAMLLFIAWLVVCLVKTRGNRSTSAGFWMNVVILIALVQLPYYELLPAQLQIVMVAAALGWRSASRAGPRVLPEAARRDPAPVPVG
jgi:hypothetical protein